MTYAEILIKKGKRGAAAFVQAECMSNKAGSSGSTQTQEVHQIPQHLQVMRMQEKSRRKKVTHSEYFFE